MNNILFTRKILNPSKGITPELLENQFIFRKTGEFIEPSFVAVALIQEPIWWNRPLHSEQLVQKDSTGMYSYNMPYIQAVESYKTGYNLLLGLNCVPIAIQIKLPENFSEEQLEKLKAAGVEAILSTLVKYNVPQQDIMQINNDVLYKKKKFVAEEHTVRNGVFTENIIVTLQYEPEKELFAKLTGEYALVRGITGIIDEEQFFTKEQFIETFEENYKNIIQNI